jgi:hypothetical protein
VIGEDSRQKEEERGRAEQRHPRAPGRFDIRAVRGRRAVFTRRELLIRALAILGVVTIGLWAYAQWLAFGPLTGRRTPTGAPLASPTPGSIRMATTAPATLKPIEPIPTRTATPSQAPSPTAVARASATSRPTETPTPLPAPTLLLPEDGATPFQQVTFEWLWEGQPLSESQAFDLRIWSAQEQERGAARRGAIAPTKAKHVSVNLAFVPAILDFGPGDYYWTVVVVEARIGASPAVVSEWGEPWRFVYR